MIRTERLNASYGRVPVLHELTLEVSDREIVAVFGRNGAGKTTLLKSIFNLGPSVTGEVMLDNASLLGLPAEQIATYGIRFVPEGGGVFERLTVEENLRVALPPRLPRQERQERVDAGLNVFPHLRERRKQLAGTLSGGERRMVAIVRAVIGRPRFVFLDEPTEGLHVRTFNTVIEGIRTLRDAFGAGIIWVDRAVEVGLALSDRYVVIERGRLSLQGPSVLSAKDGIEQRLVI
jgi:branched-chain amino acid transport system ATP-binding protein